MADTTTEIEVGVEVDPHAHAAIYVSRDPTATAASDAASRRGSVDEVPPQGGQGVILAERIFSPKRKRSQTPVREEVPETPWREWSRHPDTGTVGQKESSPASTRLEKQFEKMSLGIAAGENWEVEVDGTKDGAGNLEMAKEGPVAKKRRSEHRTGNSKERGQGTVEKSPEEDEEIMVFESSPTESEPTPKHIPWKPKEKKPFFHANGSGRRKRLKSPPLSKTRELISEQAEETGGIMGDEEEDAVDSDEDDQNGIGYVPTRTQRYVRSQKRQQQIKEYKAREAREARERRSRERNKRKSESVSGAPSPEKTEHGERKAVHFVD